MTDPPTATPAAPTLSLATAAQEGADYLMSAAASVRCMRDGEELATRLGEVEARLRSAIAAEAERDSLRARVLDRARKLWLRDECATGDASEHCPMAIGLDTADAIRLLLETAK